MNETSEHIPAARIPLRRPTIREVAANAGVSVTTVSHFLAGRSGICSPETADRISKVISEMRYIPNRVAQDLGKRSTRTIGVCLDSPADTRAFDRGSFAHRVWQGIVAAADRHEYLLLQYPFSIRHGESVDMFVNGRTDGIIMASGFDDTRPKRISEFGVPVVEIVHSANIPDDIGAVFANESLTVDVAMSHLWDGGHRRIAHLSGPTRTFDTKQGWISQPIDIAVWRERAYVAWMQRHDASDAVTIVAGHTWDGIDVAEAVRSLFETPNRPTAVFCANDCLALKAIDAALALGWQIPGDLSVVGVDNLDGGATASVPLTTVEVDAVGIGEQAMELVLALSHGTPPENLHIQVDGPRLVKRSSTGDYHESKE